MPHKLSSWLIIIVGMGVTVWGTGFLLAVKDNYGLSDFYYQIGVTAAFIFFIAGTVVTGRLTKWWDNRQETSNKR